MPPLFLFLLLLFAHVGAGDGSHSGSVDVAWGPGGFEVTVSNRFLLFTVATAPPDGQDLATQGLVRLVGDFAGEGAFVGKPNLLETPLRTMVQWNDSMLAEACTASSPPTLTRRTAWEGGGVLVSVSFASQKRSASGADVQLLSDWSLELLPNARTLIWNASGTASPGLYGVYHAIDFVPKSISALYASGVTQMMDQDGWLGYRAARDTLESVYAVGPPARGGGHSAGAGSTSAGCLEVRRQAQLVGAGSVGKVWSLLSCPGQPGELPQGRIKTLRDHDATFLVSTPMSSGLREIIVGSVPTGNLDAWGSFNFSGIDAACSARFKVSWALSTNDVPFPARSVSVETAGGDARHRRWLRAAAMGIFATVVPTLATAGGAAVAGQTLGQIQTGILHPRRGYWELFNFFDPDSYIGLMSLLLAGSPYLNEQARKVIERTGSHMCPPRPLGVPGNLPEADSLPPPTEATDAATCLPGQLPHHFVGAEPVFTAISGERQTGPNLFWALAAMEYAEVCGSREWLQTWLPVIRRAVNFLPLEPISGLDGGLLIYAPGSLMIDTFRREGFTTDTNVLMVHVLRQMARAEVRMGGSSRAMEQLARNVSDAVNALLWHTSDGDHYVTSVVRESRAASGERASSRSSSRVAPQATRVVDFVDSDSNLMAVALGVSSGPRARHILERIDRNPLARFVPTWVSERLYEGADSRPPGGTADSICGMGRIAYFNALARRRIGSPASRRFFLDHLLGKIVRDLEQLVWMPERYGPAGEPQADRTSHYFEYPAVVSLMVFQVLYGIKLGHDSISVDPWLPHTQRASSEPLGDVGLGEGEVERVGEPWTFDWDMGQLQIRYRQGRRAQVRVPRLGTFSYAISGMGPPGSRFSITVECDGERAPPPTQLVSSSEDGVVLFQLDLARCRPPAAAHERDPLGAAEAGEYQSVLLQRVESEGAVAGVVGAASVSSSSPEAAVTLS